MPFLAPIFALGHVIVQNSKQKLPLGTTVHESYDGYVVRECSRKAAKIGDELFATIGSVFSFLLTGMVIDHEWVIIRASNPDSIDSSEDIYMVAQSFKNTLGLHFIENETKGDEIGLEAGGRDKKEIESVHTMTTFRPLETTTTVGQLKEFMQDKNKPYSLAFNNCQHFADDLCGRLDDPLPELTIEEMMRKQKEHQRELEREEQAFQQAILFRETLRTDPPLTHCMGPPLRPSCNML